MEFCTSVFSIASLVERKDTHPRNVRCSPREHRGACYGPDWVWRDILLPFTHGRQHAVL